MNNSVLSFSPILPHPCLSSASWNTPTSPQLMPESSLFNLIQKRSFNIFFFISFNIFKEVLLGARSSSGDKIGPLPQGACITRTNVSTSSTSSCPVLPLADTLPLLPWPPPHVSLLLPAKLFVSTVQPERAFKNSSAQLPPVPESFPDSLLPSGSSSDP